MKNLKLTFVQNSTIVETTFNANNEKQSLIVGTALNELFTLQRNYRNAKVRLFKSNEPILFIVNDDKGNELLNIGKCSRLIQQKLKFQNNAKSMRRFAMRVNLAVTEMMRDVLVVDYSKIDALIEAMED
jgi:hypothetical protein